MMQEFCHRYRGAAFFVLVALFVVIGAFIVLPFLPAILWATVLTILTFPIYRKWKDRLAKVRFLGDGRNESVAGIFATLFTLFLILIPFLMIGVGVSIQLGGVAKGLEGSGDGFTVNSMIGQVDQAIKPILGKLNVTDFSLVKYVEENRESILQSIRAPLTGFVAQAGFTILTLVVALLTQFFMLRDGHRLAEPVEALSPLEPVRTRSVLEKVAETVRAVFVGTVLVAIIQGAIIGFAYGWAGVPNALLLGVISALLCVIPLLGAPVVYIPVGLLLLAQGDVTGAAKILLIGFLVVSQIDNVLKPFFIGERANLHPMAIFFSILGGVILIGPIGVMAGPMALTVLLALQDVLRERLAQENAPSAT